MYDGCPPPPAFGTGIFNNFHREAKISQISPDLLLAEDGAKLRMRMPASQAPCLGNHRVMSPRPRGGGDTVKVRSLSLSISPSSESLTDRGRLLHLLIFVFDLFINGTRHTSLERDAMRRVNGARFNCELRPALPSGLGRDGRASLRLSPRSASLFLSCV